MTKLSERFFTVAYQAHDAMQRVIEEALQLEEEIERLRAERDAAELMSLALKVDAERYLWIFSNCEVTYYKHDFPFASEADLDAAMKEKE